MYAHIRSFHIKCRISCTIYITVSILIESIKICVTGFTNFCDSVTPILKTAFSL